MRETSFHIQYYELLPVEIERRFLVKTNTWESSVIRKSDIVQGYVYVGSTTEPSLRVRQLDHEAFLTIKSGAGLKRTEFEYEIPFEHSEAMLDELCKDRVIRKKRHWIEQGQHLWVVDCFYGKNRGLVLAEIELTTIDEHFEKPSWLGEEVTNDARYVNALLATRPFSMETEQ